MSMKFLDSREGESSDEETNLLSIIKGVSLEEMNRKKEKNCDDIEVRFGTGFDYKGSMGNLIPTLEAIKSDLMPVLNEGHQQNMELQGAIVTRAIEENAPEVQ